MQREDTAQIVAHGGVEEAVGFHHYDGVAGLERNDDIVEIFFDTHLQPFHHGFLHGQRRGAVALCDTLAQRTVVQTDADGGAVLFAQGEKLPEFGAGHCMLLGEIARIDAHLVGNRGCGQGGVGQEMDVGHQRRVDAFCTEPLLDLAERIDLLESLGGEADQVGAGGSHRPALRERAVDVVGRGVAHGLDQDGMAAADGYAACDGEGDVTGYHRWTNSEALIMTFWG